MARTNKVYYRNSHGEFLPYYSKQLKKSTQDELEHTREQYKPFYLTPYESEPHFTIDSVRKNFRLYPTHKNFGVYTSSEESATHKYCIDAISSQNYLQVQLKNNIPNYPKGSIVKFEFNYALPEFVIPMGDNTVIRPDIVLFLRSPADLAIYFKRILAIEIVVAHNIDEKIRIYDKAQVAVLRIKANRKWGKKNESEMSKNEKEELKDWIRRSFKQTYSADLLLPKEHQIILENKVIEKAEEEKRELKEQLHDALSQLEKHCDERDFMFRKNAELERQVNLLYNNNKVLEEQNTHSKLQLSRVKNKNQVLTKVLVTVLFLTAVIVTVYVLLK